ncbi:transketolase [Patescibacteria group bacterium]|nr:transketolase [Patescibacteria group bacterium]
MEKYSLADLQIIANDIRQDIIRMLKTSGSGHAGGSLGMADIFTALYFNILDHDPKNTDSNKKDKLILSAGHICPVLYASLARAGYFPLAKLKTLRKLNSSLQGHPHNLSLAGVEVSAGPLGQGISQAVGFALAAQMDKNKAQIFCVTSDGEHNEGQTWEAIMTAAKYRLGNLINIIDYNGIQIDGKTNDIMPLGNLKKKYKSFGWQVLEVNGHKMSEIIKTLKKAASYQKSPVAVIARTVLGKGVSFMENQYTWHGKAPNAQEATKALEELQTYA